MTFCVILAKAGSSDLALDATFLIKHGNDEKQVFVLFRRGGEQ